MILSHLEAVATANQPTYGVRWRLILQHADGLMYDFRTLGGVNWCESVDWGKNVDDAGVAATIRLRRESVDGTQSLAPLVEGSELNRVLTTYAKRVHMARLFRIEVAITGAGVAPSEPDWFTVLRGRTDKVEWGGKSGVITIQARDELRLLHDYLICTGEEFEYKNSAGTPLEEVIQLMSDHYLGSSSPTFYFPQALNFFVTSYTAEAGKTLGEVIDTLAAHVGGVVEDRWGPSGFTLCVMVPNRVSAFADPITTLGPEQYLDVRDMGWDIADVRNRLRLRFRNRDTREVQTIELKDEDSIAELGGYPEGVRSIEWTEPEGSALDTPEEAAEFLSIARSDLSTPMVVQEVENLFWPWIELGDYVQWEPNFKVSDVAFTWATVGFKHSLSTMQKRTIFSCAGQAKGGQRRYTRRPNAPLDNGTGLLAFRVVSETNTLVVLGWTPSPDITEEWWAKRTVTTMVSDPWVDVTASVEPLLTGGHVLVVRKPPKGSIVLVRVEGRAYNPVKLEYEVKQAWHREVHPPEFEAKIIDITITGRKAKVIGDPSGTASIKLEAINGYGPWSQIIDGSNFQFDPPIPDNEAWDFLVTAYADPSAEIVADTQTDTRVITISNLTSGGVGEPAWVSTDEGFSVVAPAVEDDVITINLQATLAPGSYDVQVYAISASLTGFLNITTELIPVPSVPSLTPIAHTWLSPYTRREIGAGVHPIAFTIRAQIRNASDVVVHTQDRTVSYYSDDPQL